MDIYLSLAQDMVAKIAVHALNIGLLVRGGLTIGSLYHAEGVVFGEAMVDAYRLESRVATYPRVAVSSRIYTKIPEVKRQRILQDIDGIWHLDYLSKLLKNLPASEHKPWVDHCRKVIEANVRYFEAAEHFVVAIAPAYITDANARSHTHGAANAPAGRLRRFSGRAAAQSVQDSGAEVFARGNDACVCCEGS